MVSFLVFIFGLLIGSFLNVVIYRIPRGLSVVYPGSSCPTCNVSIRSFDNIPVLSWLLLGGKCRNCKVSISVRYPLIEIFVAVVFLLLFWRFGFDPFLPAAWIFSSLLIALMFIDAEHMILPNVITYQLMIFAVMARLIFPTLVTSGHFPIERSLGFDSSPIAASLLMSFLGALVAGGSLWIIGAIWKVVRGIDAMGLGDVKMMLGVGALLGWQLGLLSIFLAAFSGAVIGTVFALKERDTNFQSRMPFGVFLGAGSIFSLLVGDQIINWYVHSVLR
ncbi:MAG: prepilin peptidase [Pyrinomonadaceae bacterium]